MNIYLKRFLQRGVVFAGFGPIVMGIVFFGISLSIEDFSISGSQALLAIISTYILAFVHAGASVFNQIESWPLAKSLFCHLGCLYLIYMLCYVANSWIPFEPVAILIFTGIFLSVYFVVWMIVYISIKFTSKKINEKLAK